MIVTLKVLMALKNDEGRTRTKSLARVCVGLSLVTASDRPVAAATATAPATEEE
jgi:hypothetical protein